jgi:hypothetical protein
MIEIVTYRLREGADPDKFKAIDERLQTEFFYQQPGIHRRTTARSSDGTYVSITHWDSASAAEAAEMKTRLANEFTSLLTQFLEPSSIQSRRYDTL